MLTQPDRFQNVPALNSVSTVTVPFVVHPIYALLSHKGALLASRYATKVDLQQRDGLTSSRCTDLETVLFLRP
jgi:hypothetical protein